MTFAEVCKEVDDIAMGSYASVTVNRSRLARVEAPKVVWHIYGEKVGWTNECGLPETAVAEFRRKMAELRKALDAQAEPVVDPIEPTAAPVVPQVPPTDPNVGEDDNPLPAEF